MHTTLHTKHTIHSHHIYLLTLSNTAHSHHTFTHTHTTCIHSYLHTQHTHTTFTHTHITLTQITHILISHSHTYHTYTPLTHIAHSYHMHTHSTLLHIHTNMLHTHIHSQLHSYTFTHYTHRHHSYTPYSCTYCHTHTHHTHTMLTYPLLYTLYTHSTLIHTMFTFTQSTLSYKILSTPHIFLHTILTLSHTHTSLYIHTQQNIKNYHQRAERTQESLICDLGKSRARLGVMWLSILRRIILTCILGLSFPNLVEGDLMLSLTQATLRKIRRPERSWEREGRQVFLLGFWLKYHQVTLGIDSLVPGEGGWVMDEEI